MNNLNVDISYNGIRIKAEFSNKLNILTGYSGTGKTLLMSAIDLFCLNSGISCRLCGYNDMNLAPQKIIDICKEADVVLLDNADLYLNNEMLQSIKQTAQFVVVSIKDTSALSVSDADEYIVEYSNLDLSIKGI